MNKLSKLFFLIIITLAGLSSCQQAQLNQIEDLSQEEKSEFRQQLIRALSVTCTSQAGANKQRLK